MSKFALADNVKETTTTTGSGTVSLLGAFNSSSKTFVNGIGSTYLTAYKVDDGAGNWENRFGVIASGVPDTITNAGFISSNTGSAVTFGAGTKTVTCVPMSELFLTAAISPVLVETDIASATTTDLGSIQTLRARITGTTTITGFGTSPNTMRFVRFAGVLTLTHDSTALILPGAANIATAAGDVALFVSDGSGNWRCLWYQRGASAPNAPTRQVLTSGSGATYNTPAGVRQLRIRMVAGGGGGGGTDNGPADSTPGGTGGTTSFNSINATGGSGGGKGSTGSGNVDGGQGGTGGTGTASLRAQGQAGQSTQRVADGSGATGGVGGGSLLGGGTNRNSAAAANSGAGGGGAASGTALSSGGSGGGGGEYVEIIINNPSATYTYTVGSTGTAGAAGTGGAAGKAGGTGVIIVDEVY